MKNSNDRFKDINKIIDHKKKLSNIDILNSIDFINSDDWNNDFDVDQYINSRPIEYRKDTQKLSKMKSKEIRENDPVKMEEFKAKERERKRRFRENNREKLRSSPYIEQIREYNKYY